MRLLTTLNLFGVALNGQAGARLGAECKNIRDEKELLG